MVVTSPHDTAYYTSAAYGAADSRTGRRVTIKPSVPLWIVQTLLAALFLFAGGFKLAVPAELLAAASPLPVPFLRFIGTCETLGALGLILPGLTRIRPALTPLAAAGLVIIMIGATTVTALLGDPLGALFPAVVGILAASVAYGRSRVAPHPTSWRRGALQPAN